MSNYQNGNRSDSLNWDLRHADNTLQLQLTRKKGQIDRKNLQDLHLHMEKAQAVSKPKNTQHSLQLNAPRYSARD